MNQLVNIASSISTPLALGGLLATIIFAVIIELIRKNKLGTVSSQASAAIIKMIIDKLFILSLVAMVLGFTGYVIQIVYNTHHQSIPAHITTDDNSSAYEEQVYEYDLSYLTDSSMINNSNTHEEEVDYRDLIKKIHFLDENATDILISNLQECIFDPAQMSLLEFQIINIEYDPYDSYFDIYFKNITTSDILITRIAIILLSISHRETDAQAALGPSAEYYLPVGLLGERCSASLDISFVVKAHSVDCMRISTAIPIEDSCQLAIVFYYDIDKQICILENTF